MQAKETRLQEIIEGTKQYVIPLFQRSYSWMSKHWEVLWEDISELSEMENPRTHFMGSIVNMPTTSVPHGVTKFLLIDGQQRLTTILVVLALIRDKAREEGNDRLADEIHNTLLVNQYKDGSDKYKLLPTQVDRLSYIKIIENEEESESPVLEAYHFFEKKLKSNPIDLKKMLKIITECFSVVSIVLDANDNPYLVFESLNAKGRPLTQADLIKNYFFMRIHQDHQEEIYNKYWMPMQTALGEDLPEFIRHFMMKEGGIIRLTDVYYTLKEKVNEENAIDYIKELSKYSSYYNSFIHPESETDHTLRNHFARLNRIEATTAYPILLYYYGEYKNGSISFDGLTEVLSALENYLIRRFVCDYKTNQLNKIFPSAYSYIKAYRIGTEVEAFKAFLSERGYPKDNEFSNRFKVTRMYGGGERKAKTNYILESLEQSYHHKEKVDFSNLSIEHIMPRTLSEWWQGNLGEDWENIHYELLDTIGNLTLTAYNSELSNDTYDVKRDIYAESHLDLNKYFASIYYWGKDQIIQRAESLAQRALEIWPYFGEGESTGDSEDNITGSTPYEMEILGEKFNVKTWRDVFELTLNTLSELAPEKFEAVADALSKYIGKDMNKFRAVRQLKNGYYVEMNLSATTIYKNCQDVIKISGLSPSDWSVSYSKDAAQSKSAVKDKNSDHYGDLFEVDIENTASKHSRAIEGCLIDDILEEYESKEDAPTRYSLNGSDFMKANVFVREVVRNYWGQHREATFQELQKVFPDPRKEGSFGVIRSLEFIKNRGYKGRRYFLEPENVMTSSDGIEFAVSTEWSWHNAPAFALHARELGFEVKAVNNRKDITQP